MDAGCATIAMSLAINGIYPAVRMKSRPWKSTSRGKTTEMINIQAVRGATVVSYVYWQDILHATHKEARTPKIPLD
jgi:hypothetical protein